LSNRETISLGFDSLWYSVWASILEFACFFLAFREIASSAWIVCGGILFVSALNSANRAGRAYLQDRSRRSQIIDQLGMIYALRAIQSEVADEFPATFGSDNEKAFWLEMRGKAAEDIRDEDEVEEAGYEIDHFNSLLKMPRWATWAFFSIAIDVALVFFAKFLAALWS
jgi:hypothetical protein